MSSGMPLVRRAGSGGGGEGKRERREDSGEGAGGGRRVKGHIMAVQDGWVLILLFTQSLMFHFIVAFLGSIL